MENQLKFYLLAEKSGWDCSAYAYEYRKKFVDSDSYQILSYNVKEARKHLSGYAKEICKEFENLKMEPRNLEETFILETKINYLSLHSFPEYYLNPFAVDPNYSGEVTSIGDLILDCMGNSYSFNELILDESIGIENKTESIKRKVEDYLDDMQHLVSVSMESLEKERLFSKQKQQKIELLKNIFQFLLLILANVFFFFTLIYPLNCYWDCFYNPKWNTMISYTSYLLPIFLFLYDFFFALFHSYKAKVSQTYQYARRFLKHNLQKVYDDIAKNASLLENYLLAAVNGHILLKDDIKDFSKLSTSYIDLKKVLSMYDLKKQNRYRIFRSLNDIFSTIAFVVWSISFVVYICALVLKIPF